MGALRAAAQPEGRFNRNSPNVPSGSRRWLRRRCWLRSWFLWRGRGVVDGLVRVRIGSPVHRGTLNVTTTGLTGPSLATAVRTAIRDGVLISISAAVAIAAAGTAAAPSGFCRRTCHQQTSERSNQRKAGNRTFHVETSLKRRERTFADSSSAPICNQQASGHDPWDRPGGNYFVVTVNFNSLLPSAPLVGCPITFTVKSPRAASSAA